MTGFTLRTPDCRQRSLAAIFLILGTGCGGESGPAGHTSPEGPTYELSIVAGNAQRGFPDAQLARPVVFELKSGSVPVAAQPVVLSVPLGSAFVQPVSATTDDDGRVSALVTLGSDPGPVWIRAEVPELEVPSVQATLEVLQTEAVLLNSDLGVIYDLVLDVERRRVYVTHHEDSTVGAYDTETGELQWSLPVDGRPYGADLSSDGSELFVALAGAGTVAAIDVTSLDVETIPVESVTGHTETWDVVETSPGTLFVSANPGSSALAYIGKVDRSNPADAIRVADERDIRGRPQFVETNDGADLLVTEESFSPNSLYRLDLTQPTAPIVGEDSHGDIRTVWWARLDRAGSRLYLGSGQVVDPETFVEVGSVPGGSSVTSADDAIAFVFNADGFRAYETTGFNWIGDVDLPTSNAEVWLAEFPETDRLMFATAGELWDLQLIVPN